MEGPSLLLASQQLTSFKGKKVLRVYGNTQLPKEICAKKEIKDIFSWGKHLVFQFDTFALRVHFLLFGTFEATVDDVSVTGDYKRSREPRLALVLANGEVKMFNCSIKLLETSDAKNTYDFTIDIMSPKWNPKKAFDAIKANPKEEIADVLLNQEIFSGVGNIIKNEVLHLAKLHPMMPVEDISDATVQKLIAITQEFSKQFYIWRKAFVLRKHLQIYQKSVCPYCGGKVTRAKTGKRERWSYVCPVCQPAPLRV